MKSSRSTENIREQAISEFASWLADIAIEEDQQRVQRIQRQAQELGEEPVFFLKRRPLKRDKRRGRNI